MTDQETTRTTHGLLTLEHWKRTLFHLIWFAPGVIAILPYMMQPVDGATVGAALDYYIGLWPWLWARPLRMAMMLPTVAYFIRFARVGPVQ